MRDARVGMSDYGCWLSLALAQTRVQRREHDESPQLAMPPCCRAFRRAGSANCPPGRPDTLRSPRPVPARMDKHAAECRFHQNSLSTCPKSRRRRGRVLAARRGLQFRPARRVMAGPSKPRSPTSVARSSTARSFSVVSSADSCLASPRMNLDVAVLLGRLPVA